MSLQTICEKVGSWFRNDPFESNRTQRKYENFVDLLPEGDHTFGQFQVECSGNRFNVWFKDIELLDSVPNFSLFGTKRIYYWIWKGPSQQDFINFIDEYIARKTTENELAANIRKDARLATMLTYVPGKVIF